MKIISLFSLLLFSWLAMSSVFKTKSALASSLEESLPKGMSKYNPYAILEREVGHSYQRLTLIATDSEVPVYAGSNVFHLGRIEMEKSPLAHSGLGDTLSFFYNLGGVFAILIANISQSAYVSVIHRQGPHLGQAVVALVSAAGGVYLIHDTIKKNTDLEDYSDNLYVLTPEHWTQKARLVFLFHTIQKLMGSDLKRENTFIFIQTVLLKRLIRKLTHQARYRLIIQENIPQ